MSKNRLADQTSPYLRQHADNPVHWWPWSPDALEEARRTGKPILLSVGYAACHWCHVMAHESFENAATAEVMNELYVNIKVDREERPDVDQVYMSALHAMGQQGGWPLTMFLTPDGAPFFGGTYFPHRSAYGRPGFTEVLQGIAQAYRDRGEEVTKTINAILERIGPQSTGHAMDLTRADLDTVANQLAGVMDPIHGGMKGAPKFPNTPLLEFLWRAGDRTGEPRYSDHFLHSLSRICQGGIYDHVGGGFARYSVDEQWLAPHFEKMLYDNAQLLELLALAFQSSGDDLFRRRAEETVGWLSREMVVPGGGFASSLDADSEGHEGKFYIWTRTDVDAVLGPEDGAAFSAAYDITPDGNWEGVSIPNRLRVETDLDEARFAPLRTKLLDARAKRVRPGLDDKILTDWNGLMIAALARASSVFQRPDWLVLARTAFDFVSRETGRGDRLGHSFRDGHMIYPGFASDLASMTRAALALFEVSGEADYIAQAEKWMAALDRHYSTPDGGLFLTADDGESLAVRPLASRDEAVPSAAGLALDALLKLAVLTGKESYTARADTLIRSLAGSAARDVFGHLSILNGLDTRLAGLEIAIVGDASGALTAAAKDLPFIARTVNAVKNAEALPDNHPARNLADGGPRALVCAGNVCGLPIAEPDALAANANALRRGEARFA